MKLLLILFASLALTFGVRADDDGRRILEEVNLARTQPQVYAEIVERAAGRNGAAGEAVRFLERAEPRKPLRHSAGLARAAQSHVCEQGDRGDFGHSSRNGTRCFDRIARYGQWQDAVGENIDYGSSSPRAIVVRLIVDRGVFGRKHRANIFNKTFRVAGIAAGSHARYGSMCVMDFAGDFIARRNFFADR